MPIGIQQIVIDIYPGSFSITKTIPFNYQAKIKKAWEYLKVYHIKQKRPSETEDLSFILYLHIILRLCFHSLFNHCFKSIGVVGS